MKTSKFAEQKIAYALKRSNGNLPGFGRTAGCPNQLWVLDFTYVSTWQGWLYVAFLNDVFARRIVGWRVSSFMHTDFALDAWEQALYDRDGV